VPRVGGAGRRAPGDRAVHGDGRCAPRESAARPAIRPAHLRGLLVQPASPGAGGVQRLAGADRERGGDPEALQGLAAGGRAHVAARLVQPCALHVRRRRPLRPPGGGGIHPSPRPAAVGICPAARRKRNETAGMLHTGRSRNDQIALDLRLHVREQIALALEELAGLIGDLADRATRERDILLPGYTHRQRAQAVSASYYLCAWGAMFQRDSMQLGGHAAFLADHLPLGVGALAGTSLPIDRSIVADLLRFDQVTSNGLDTVGDRDFALDFAYGAVKVLLHASRVATD